MEAHTEAQGDPFATGEDDPFATQPAAEAEIEAETVPPVVDREGQPVEAAPEEAPEATATPEAPPEPQPAEGGEGAPPEEPPAAPADAPQPPEATASTPEAQDGAQAGGEATQTASAAKGQMRYYRVLYQTDAKQWTEAVLDANDPDVTRLDDGELWLVARNNEHATRLAWKVLGAPQGGVTAFPVPKGAWKPKRIKPAAPRPERERLEIS